MKFKESTLAHKYLDGLTGIEIGGSAHNPFGLNTINVDRTGSMETTFKKVEVQLCGEAQKVDVVAEGDRLPFADKSYDFVLVSHVIEHFFDPIAALKEWKRVARKYIFIIVPHRDRTFDKERELTVDLNLLNRHLSFTADADCLNDHWAVFEPENFLDLCLLCGLNVVETQDPDDKVGNGFTVVIKLD